MGISRTRRGDMRQAVVRRRRRRFWIAAIAGVTVAGALATIVVFWASRDSGSRVPRHVAVTAEFDGTVTILNGQVGGCVRPLDGSVQTCGWFLLTKGETWPSVGRRVNVAVLAVPSKDDSGYVDLLIYPDLMPSNVF